MAGNAVIGALRVVLGADTAALESGLKDGMSAINVFAGKLGIVGQTIGNTLAGVFASFKVSAIIDDLDKMGKAAQSVGLPVEELSKLKYAADQSNVSMDTLSVSLGKLGRNMSQAAGGGAGPAADAFKAMGITLQNTDGTLRSTSDVLGDIAAKFKSYEDSAAKTALAIAVFGKAGASMVPLLNQGRDGLSAATSEAERFGLVIDGKTAAAADAFNTNLQRMSAISQGMWTQITAQMLPAFLQLSKVLLENKENSTLFKTAADGIVTAIRGAVTVAVTATVAFQRLGAEAYALWQVLTAPTWDKMKDAWAGFVAAGDETKKRFDGLNLTIGQFWKDADVSMSQVGDSAQKKMAAPIIEASEKAKNALQSFLDSTLKRTAGLAAEAATIGQSRFETDKLRIAMEAEQVAKNNNITITDALRQKIDQVGQAYATMAEKANFAKQLFEQTRTPLEQYQSAIEDLNGAYQRGSINGDLYARGVAQAQQKFIEADPYAQAFSTSITSAFDKAIQGGSKLSDVLKGLLQDLARALANQAFKQLLLGGQGSSSGGVLGGLVGGIGKLFGFADGGSFQVGGSGGIDSQLVAFRASPNERVSVTKPGQSAGGGDGIVVQVVSTVDKSGNLLAFVQNVSGSIAGQAVRAATPSIVSQAAATVSTRNKNAPSFIRKGV